MREMMMLMMTVLPFGILDFLCSSNVGNAGSGCADLRNLRREQVYADIRNFQILRITIQNRRKAMLFIRDVSWPIFRSLVSRTIAEQQRSGRASGLASCRAEMSDDFAGVIHGTRRRVVQYTRSDTSSVGMQCSAARRPPNDKTPNAIYGPD